MNLCNLDMIDRANDEGCQDPNDVDDLMKEVRAWRKAALAMFDAETAGDREAIAAALSDLRALIPQDNDRSTS